MILGFDADRQTLTIDFEDGSAPVDVHVRRLLVKRYDDVGILFADMQGSNLEVGFLMAEDERGQVSLDAVDDATWRVRFALV